MTAYHYWQTKKTFNLPKKPAKGGIPALEKSRMANVTANVGLALDRELKSVIDLTNSSFFSAAAQRASNLLTRPGHFGPAWAAP